MKNNIKFIRGLKKRLQRKYFHKIFIDGTTFKFIDYQKLINTMNKFVIGDLIWNEYCSKFEKVKIITKEWTEYDTSSHINGIPRLSLITIITETGDLIFDCRNDIYDYTKDKNEKQNQTTNR